MNIFPCRSQDEPQSRIFSWQGSHVAGLCVAMLLSLSLDTAANAQSLQWVGYGSDFTDRFNWYDGQFSGIMPSSGSSVVIGNFANQGFSDPVLNQNFSVNSALIYNGITLSGSGSLTMAGAFTLGLDAVSPGASVSGVSVNAGTFDLRNGTISSVLTGSGNAVKSTAATVTLTGANTYTGSTVVDAGTLSVTGSGSLASTVISISSGATLQVDGGALSSGAALTNSGAWTLSGNETVASTSGAGTITLSGAGTTLTLSSGNSSISGSMGGTGGLTIAGGATTSLSGANTYTGNTIVAGTLNLSGGSAIEDTAAVSVSSGVLNVNTSETFGSLSSGVGSVVNLNGTTLTTGGNNASTTVTGVVAGSGSLVKVGSGTMSLAGANTYTGSTTVSAGTLALSGAGTLASTALTIASGAALQSDGGRLAGGTALVNNGTVALTGGETIASLNGAGDVTLALGSVLTLTTGSSVLSGSVSGAGGLAVTGGTTTLSGLNTYSGATSVNAGALVVDGSIAASTLTTINVGARLMGIGTLGNTMIASGGILAPGNSVGTINVSGNLGISAGSIYDVDISPSDSDRVAVSGTATLNGGTVRVRSAAAANQFSGAPSNFTILTATGGISGTFNALDTSALAFFDGTLDYSNTNAVQLLLTRNDLDLAGVAVTGNQSGTAQGIQSLGSSNPIYAAILTMSPEEAQAAYDQLSGEPHATVEQALGDSVLATLGLMSNRMGQSPSGGNGVLSMIDAGDGPVDKSTPANVLWGNFYGNFGELTGTSGAADAQSSAGGIVLGADGLLGGWRLGAVVSAGHTNVTVPDRASTTKAADFGVGLYGGTSFGQANIKVALSHIYHDVHSSRTVTVPGLASVLEAVYGATTTQGYGELGYSIDLGPAQIEPYAQLGVVRQIRDGFTEAGGLVALSSAATQSTSAYASLGVRGSMLFALEGEASARVSGGIAYRHDFGGTIQTVNNFAGGSAFAVSGAKPTTDALLLETAVSYELSRNVGVNLSYNGAFGNAGTNHTVQAGLAIGF